MDIYVDIYHCSAGLPTFETSLYGLQSQKKATTFEIAIFFRRRRPAAFSSRFQKKCPIANGGGGRSSLRATVLWGASLHSLTSSHLHALGEYRPHAIRVLTCRLTCADLSSRAFSNYPL
jgi:hypothetical protein